MSTKPLRHDTPRTRTLIVIGHDALRRKVTRVIKGLKGVKEIRTISTFRQLESEAIDEYGAFIVGEAFDDASPTDVVALIREHRDDAPILVALVDDPDRIGIAMLERGADECVDLNEEHSMYLLIATLEKHLELSRIKRENLRLQVALAQSLAELKRKNRELEEQAERLETIASTDLLTSLANRWRLQERMNPMFAESTRYGDDLACLMIDLDNFKAINDTLGHQAGDDLLATVGRIITEQVRASDIAARIGGDEFVIVLLETSKRKSNTFAKRLHKQLRDTVYLTSESLEVRITASLGVAALPKDADTKEELLRLADHAMYHVKANGRDGIQQA